jgi:hypothetical protein
MGEANRARRRAAEGAPVHYRDMRTGEIKLGRQAPPPRQYAIAYMAISAAAEVDPKIAAPVPCNGCTACCYKRVDVDPAREPPENLGHLNLVPNAAAATTPEFPMMLQRRADGGCVHLGSEGCTVRPYRPLGCRMFDCRFSALAGIYPPEADERPDWPRWVFATRSLDDRLFLAMLQFGAFRYYRAHPGGSDYEVMLAAFAFVDQPGAWEKMREGALVVERFLANRTPAEKQAIFAEVEDRQRAAIEELEGQRGA